MHPLILARRHFSIPPPPPLAVTLISSTQNTNHQDSHNFTVDVGEAGDFQYLLGVSVYKSGGGLNSIAATLDGHSMSSVDAVQGGGSLRSSRCAFFALSGVSIEGSVTLTTSYNTTATGGIQLIKVNRLYDTTPHDIEKHGGTAATLSWSVDIPLEGLLMAVGVGAGGVNFSNIDTVTLNGGNASVGDRQHGYDGNGIATTFNSTATFGSSSGNTACGMMASFGEA